MSSKILTIALIGYGYWGPNLLRNYHAHPRVKVKTVCDLVESNLQKVNREYPSLTTTSSVETVFSDPEVQAIILAVPTAHHFSLAEKALRSGKHVFIEKPMTQTVEHAQELEKLARKYKKVVCVDHPFVFSEPIKHLKKMITDGGLGSIYTIESSRMNLGLFQKDMNVIDDLAPHDLSIIDYLLDRQIPDTIKAFGSRHVHHTQLEQAHIHLTYAGGIAATIHLSWLSPLKIRQLMIIGSKKMVVFDDTQPSDKIWIYDKGVEIKKDELNPFQPFYRSGDVLIPKLPQTETLANVADAFVQTVLDKKPAINDVQAGRRVVELLQSIQKSL